MTIYATFDTSGRATGFWDDRLFPPQESGERNEAIPPEAIEISESVYGQLLANPNARYIDGEIVIITPPTPMPSPDWSWGPMLVDVVGRA